MSTPQATSRRLSPAATCCLAATIALVVLTAGSASCHPQVHQSRGFEPRASASMFAARRAADDSRPLARSSRRSDSGESSIVVGKFKAPAPERIQVQRIPASSSFGSQTLGASYRVADDDDSPARGAKIVHGIIGASASSQPRTTSDQRQQRGDQRTVKATMRVSDEGLNYPPSKLSADIYGNVAEIVTAPPEAVESDFLIPHSSRFGGSQSRRSF